MLSSLEFHFIIIVRYFYTYLDVDFDLKSRLWVD